MKPTGIVLVFTHCPLADTLPYILDTEPISAGLRDIRPHFQKTLTGFIAE